MEQTADPSGHLGPPSIETQAKAQPSRQCLQQGVPGLDIIQRTKAFSGEDKEHILSEDNCALQKFNLVYFHELFLVFHAVTAAHPLASAVTV